MSKKNNLPDVQSGKSNIKLPIKEVGVENVEVPFLLQLRNDDLNYESLCAKVSMRANLDEDTKGISMSRFIRTLIPFLNLPLKHDLIKEILVDLRNKVESNNVFIKFNFKLPKPRKSVISDYEFPVFYKCKFEGQLIDGSFRFFQGVKVQYASYCPCSAALSKDLIDKGLNGFPHNQRSFANIMAEIKENNYIWVEDLIDIVEDSIKTIPYPIIKREDEQEIARIASENPIFVEDAIRAISNNLNKNEKIYDWIVKCVHEESIHTSEAIAVTWKGIEGGFCGEFFL